jgi:hypothetical protein
MTANSAVRPVSELEAWRVDAATGIFTRVAMPIPFGALTLYGFAKVPGVDAVYVARTGGVSQVVLPASPSFTFTVAAHNSVTGVPAGIFADPRGGRLFVTDTAQNRVTSLSVGSGGAVATSVVAAGTPGQKFARSMAMFNH